MTFSLVLLVACSLPAAELLSVDTLAQLSFQRVKGGAYGQSVLAAGNKSDWYAAYVSCATVDYDGDLYRMWFSGGALTDDTTVPYGALEAIGMATSSDGIHWQIANQGQPVLVPGPAGSVDAKSVAHPFVIRVGEKYWMWYGAIDGKRGQDINVEPAHVRVERICLATSLDGIHWERENGGQPVLDIGPPGTTDSLQATGMHVIRRGDEFVMWYGAYNGRHTLAVATSPDGIHWVKANDGNPVTGLEGEQQLGPSVYFDGNRYFMFYNKDLDGSWAIFSATSHDGFHWTPANSSQPILGPPPPGNFGSAGKGRNHSVHPSKIVIVGNRVRVWYGGEDGLPPHKVHIGLMEAKLP